MSQIGWVLVLGAVLHQHEVELLLPLLVLDFNSEDTVDLGE